MHPPDPLSAQLFLLAVRPEKQRLAGRNELGYVLRAAALVELQLSGHLIDDDGRPGVRQHTGVTDPVLDAVLRQVADGPRRRWQYWIRKDARRITRAVRDRLAEQRRITVESYRILGIFPAQRIGIVDPLLRTRLMGVIDTALGDSARVTPHVAALVALAAAGELRTVLPRSKRRAHRERIAELTERTGPIPKALRAVLRELRAAAANG